MFVLKAKLLADRHDIGGYIVYVFQNLEHTCIYKDKYVMVTRFPNWESPSIKIGDVGYLKYKEVKAGEDTWWDSTTNQYNKYKYDSMIFLEFIHERKSSTVIL